MGKKNIEKYSAGYALLKYFVDLWHNNIFYRKVIVLGRDNIIAISDPVYPVYENATIMSGRAGVLNDDQKWSNIVYLRCNKETSFIPELPTEKVDVIYL